MRQPLQIRVRLADPGLDAEAIAAIYGPAVEDSAASFEEALPDALEIADRIRRTLLWTPWLVAEDANANVVIGYAYAAPHHERAGYRWSVDVSAYISPDRRGQGIGRQLYDALLPMLRRQGFVSVYAGIALPNRRVRGCRPQAGRLARRCMVRDADHGADRSASGADSAARASGRGLTLDQPEGSCSARGWRRSPRPTSRKRRIASCC